MYHPSHSLLFSDCNDTWGRLHVLTLLTAQLTHSPVTFCLSVPQNPVTALWSILCPCLLPWGFKIKCPAHSRKQQIKVLAICELRECTALHTARFLGFSDFVKTRELVLLLREEKSMSGIIIIFIYDNYKKYRVWNHSYCFHFECFFCGIRISFSASSVVLSRRRSVPSLTADPTIFFHVPQHVFFPDFRITLLS
jgi:hypothetical protein